MHCDTHTVTHAVMYAATYAVRVLQGMHCDTCSATHTAIHALRHIMRHAVHALRSMQCDTCSDIRFDILYGTCTATHPAICAGTHILCIIMRHALHVVIQYTDCGTLHCNTIYYILMPMPCTDCDKAHQDIDSTATIHCNTPIVIQHTAIQYIDCGCSQGGGYIYSSQGTRTLY